MAAGRKEYELLMKLSAALSPGFNTAFQTAMNTTKKLQDTLSNVQKVQKSVDGFKKTQDAIAAAKKEIEDYVKKHESLQGELLQTIAKEKELQTAVRKAGKNAAAATDIETYKKLSAEHDRLQKELAQTTAGKRTLERDIRANEAATEGATREIQKQENRLAGLSDELRQAGINTDNLSKENDRLKQTYDNLKNSQENFARANADLEKNKQAISATKTELLQTVGVATAFAAAIALPVKGAMEFESSMAEVAKVVDWIGNGNNATAEQIQQYNELSKGIYGLTRQIPMTAQEFAKITAAAGQAGVAMDNAGLLRFAGDAAKMGIAFDVSAEQAGAFMAQWRTAFKMTQEEVVALSDVINYLGNTTPATAAQISSVVTRIGPLGEVAGLTSKELAALGAAIVGVGIDESVAATGIKNLMLDMTKGTAATAKMHGVLESLGTSATDLAARMQTDATGAIMDFMRAVKQLPEAEQAAALTTYFGQESVAAIAPLLSNLDNLQAQFYKVADAGQYAGSMEKEYAARAATSENTLAILKNAVKELSDAFGAVFVPEAASGAQALTEVIYKVTDFVKENKETIATVVKVAAGLLAVKIAYLGVKIAVLSVIGVYKTVRLAMAAYQVTQAAMAAGMGAWNIVSGMASVSNYALAGSFLAVAGPALAIVAAVAAVIAITVLLVRNWDKVKEAASRVWETVKNMFGKIAGFLGGIIDKITAPFIAAINWYVKNVIQPIISIFWPIVRKTGQILAKIWEIITVLFGVLAVWFKDNVIAPIAGLFGSLIQTASGIFQNIWSAITTVFFSVAGWFSARFTAAWEAVKAVFAPVGEFFKGVWDKIVAVFTSIGTAVGNAIGDTFKFVVNSVIGFAEGTINNFINGINAAIKLINAIPGVSVELLAPLQIPRLEQGSNYTPDTFIAGDVNGRGGELVTGAKGRKVFTAAQTSAIFDNINMAREINNALPRTAAPVSGSDTPPFAERAGSLISALKSAAIKRASETLPPPLTAMLPTSGGDKSQSFTIQYSPTIYVDGNKPGDLEEKLKKHDETLLQKIQNLLRQQQDDERRTAYA